MSGITVTPEQLAAIGQQLNSGAGQIEGTLSQLANLVSPLHSEWQGSAQAAFENLWSEWQTAARNLHEALTGISRLTVQASSTYAQTEQGITTSFAS